MTEIVHHSDLADEMRYAQAVAVQPERGTGAAQSLLPAAYRGNPANVLIAVGLGKAMGIAPAQALYDIYVVNGRPSPSANLMAALVRRAGHKIRIDGDATSCTATLIRKDDPDEPFRATWTIEQARGAGLAGKDTWKQYPAAMLRSRAIAEVVRMGASECVLGMDYSAEEMRDVETTPAAASPTFVPADDDLDTKRRRVAEDIARMEANAPAAEPVEATLEPDEHGEVPRTLTTKTRGHIFGAFSELYPEKKDDDQAQRDYFGWALGLGGPIASRKDIDEDMGQRIVDVLEAEKVRREIAAVEAGA